MTFKKYLLIFGLLASRLVLASEASDLKFIDNLYRERNFSQAMTSSERFLTIYPNSRNKNNVREKLAKLYFLNKNYDKAIRQFKILDADTKYLSNDEYKYYLARCYALTAQAKTALFYKNTIKSSSLKEKTEFELANDLLTTKDNKNASIIFSNIVNKRNKYYSEALFSLGIAYFNDGNYAKAYQVLTMTNQNNDMTRYMRAASLYKLNRVDEAAKFFENILANEEKTNYDDKAILNLIEIYSNARNKEKVNYYINLIEGTDLHKKAMLMLGDYFASNQDYDKALKQYAKSDDSSNPKLIYNSAYSLYKLGKYREALEKFESLRDSNYYNQAIYYIFAIEYKLKNYQKIIDNKDIMKRVVLTQTDNDNINTIIANSAYQLGNYKLSKDYYGRLFAINTKAENLFRVILLDSQMLDIADLENRFRQYRNKFPNDKQYKKDIYLYTAEAYYKTGNAERAIEIYKEYLDEDNNFEILSALLLTLMEEKRYDEMEFYLANVQDETKLQYLKGISAMGLGKHDEAENFFQQAKDNLHGTMNYKLEINRLRNFFLAAKYESAIRVGEAAIQNTKIQENTVIYQEILDKIALSYFRLENYEKAREYYRKISNIAGYDLYSKYQIADSYYNEKNYALAKEKFLELKNSYPESFYGEQAHYRYIAILGFEKNKEAYEEEKNKFLSKYSNSKFSSSLESDNLLKKDPVIPEDEKLFKEAKKLVAAKNLKKALENYKKIYTEHPDSKYIVDARLAAAEIYDKLGDEKSAKQQFFKLYSVKNNKDLHEYCLEKLIYYRLKENNTKEAKRYLSELEKTNPSKAKKYKVYF